MHILRFFFLKNLKLFNQILYVWTTVHFWRPLALHVIIIMYISILNDRIFLVEIKLYVFDSWEFLCLCMALSFF